MTVATAISPPDGADTNSPGNAPSGLCPQCGGSMASLQPPSAAASASGDAEVLLRQAREQITALQSQVSHLDQKAASAIDRWADYEDELAGLRRQLAAASAAAASLSPASPPRTSFLPTGAANRISALLSARAPKPAPILKELKEDPARSYSQAPATMPTPPPTATHMSSSASVDYMLASTPPPRTPYGSFPLFGGKMQRTPSPRQPQPPPQPPSPSTKELMEALTREQKLRRAAEGRLNDTSREVEELSVSLFEQANQMVADERRARARLEARVAVLEQRDTDKKARLERLELAMNRIGRLRAMLDADAHPGSTSPEAAKEATAADAATDRHAEA